MLFGDWNAMIPRNQKDYFNHQKQSQCVNSTAFKGIQETFIKTATLSQQKAAFFVAG